MNPVLGLQSSFQCGGQRWIGNSVLKPYLFTYEDLFGHLGYTGDMRQALKTRDWPTVGRLKNNVIVTLTGGHLGDVNNRMERAMADLVNDKPRRVTTFLCPDVDASDEHEVSGKIDGIAAKNSKFFVCKNLKMGDHAGDVLTEAYLWNQMVHAHGISGNYNYKWVEYSCMVSSLGGQFIGLDHTGSDTWVPGWTRTNLPLVHRRAYLPAFHSIQHVGSHLCLDVKHGTPGNGVDIVLWSCHGGRNQDWSLTAEAQYRSRANNKYCLDIDGANAGSGKKIHTWNCDGGSSEKWLFHPQYGYFKSLEDTAYCLAVDGGSGSQLTMRPCNASDSAQKFQLVKKNRWLDNNK